MYLLYQIRERLCTMAGAYTYPYTVPASDLYRARVAQKLLIIAPKTWEFGQKTPAIVTGFMRQEP